MAALALVLGLAIALGILVLSVLTVTILYLKRDAANSSHKRSTSTSGEKGLASLSSFKALSFKKLAAKHGKTESGEPTEPGALGTSASYKDLLSAGLTIRLYAQSEIANGVAYIAGTPHSIWDLIQAGVDFDRKVVPISDSKGQEIAILIQSDSCRAFFANGADVLADDGMRDVWAPLFHFAANTKSDLGKRTSANVEMGTNLSKLIGSDSNILPNSVTSAWIRAGLGMQDRLEALVPIMQNLVDRAMENAILLAKEGADERTDIVETMEALTLALIIRCIFGDDVYSKEGAAIAHLLRTIRNIVCDSINLQTQKSLQELAHFYGQWAQLVDQIILNAILTAEALGQTKKSTSFAKPPDYLGWLTSTLKKNGAPSAYFASLPSHLLTFCLQTHVHLHNILSWIMIDVVGNPMILSEAQRQATLAVSTTNPTSAFIDRCLKESYRLHSPALITRKRLNAEAVHLGPTLIASNILIAASPYVQNSDAVLFEDPDSYQPSRWLGANSSRPTSPSPAHLRAPKLGQAQALAGSSESLLTPHMTETPRPQLSRLRGPADTFIDFSLNVVCTAIFANFHLKPRATGDGTALAQVDQVFASERGLWCAWPQTNAFFTVERGTGYPLQGRSMSAGSLSIRSSPSALSLQQDKRRSMLNPYAHGIEINIKRATVLDPVEEGTETATVADVSEEMDEVDALTAVESVATLARRTTANSRSPVLSDYASTTFTERESLTSVSPHRYPYAPRGSAQAGLGISDSDADSIYLSPLPRPESEMAPSKTNSAASLVDDFAELERQLLTPLSRSGSVSSLPPASPSHSMLSAASSPPMTPVSDQRYSQVTDNYQWESQLARMGIPYIREQSSSTLTASNEGPQDDVTERLEERGRADLLRVDQHLGQDPRQSIGASSLYTQSSSPYSHISNGFYEPSELDHTEVMLGTAHSGSDQASRTVTPTGGFGSPRSSRTASPEPASMHRRPLPKVPSAIAAQRKRTSVVHPKDHARLSMVSQYSEATRFADANEDELAAMPPPWHWSQPLAQGQAHMSALKLAKIPPRNTKVRPLPSVVTDAKGRQHAMPLPLIVRSATNESLRRDFTWVGDAVGVRESTYRFSKFYNR